MGHTRSRHYNRYTLEYKLQAVKLADHPGVKATDVAESLGIHVVMLYRWQMEHRRGELRANKHMKPEKPSPKRRSSRTDPLRQKQDELDKANKRIARLEKELANSMEEIDLLKKLDWFLAEKRKQSLKPSRGTGGNNR
ncbi:MAG TPA: transposase [Candidatus Acidoferrum sp.]|nr:transposase [Candidatus Acidoferrum sp.]